MQKNRKIALFLRYLWYLFLRRTAQFKVFFVKPEQTVSLRSAQFAGQCTAFHAQIIRQLLPVERDVEHIHPRMHGFGGKLEQKALPNGVRGDVADFLGHHQIFGSCRLQKVVQKLQMRLVGQHGFAPQTIWFQKQHEDWPRRSHAHQQRRVQYTGMGFGKHLSRPHMSRNVLVAPRISAHYIGPTPQHKPQRSHPLAGTQDRLPFIVLLLPSTQILQQHRALGRIQPHKQRGGGPLRKIWLNLFSCGIDVKWSMCGGSCAGIVFEANITGGSATQYIHLPSGLSGLCNSKTIVEVAQSGREVYLLHGELERDETSVYPACGQKMHIHGSRITMLRHLCFGCHLSTASFEKGRYRCPCYDHTKMDSVPLKADVHNITRELLREFEPQVLKKNQTSISQDIEEKILSMYAKGKLDT